MEFSVQNLATFLVEAHHNTYANSSAKKAPPLRLGSKDYHFELDDFSYHDTYFGESRFIGEEIIYFRNKPIWGMNYHGSPISPEIPESEIDAILRPALMQEPWPELPIRGPKSFLDTSHQYLMQIREGNLEKFSAEERILLDNELIYQCFLHGGFIL